MCLVLIVHHSRVLHILMNTFTFLFPHGTCIADYYFRPQLPISPYYSSTNSYGFSRPQSAALTKIVWRNILYNLKEFVEKEYIFGVDGTL